MACVFQNIDPPPPHPPHRRRVCTPVFGAGGKNTRWVERGWWVNILEDARHSSVLYVCKYFVGNTMHKEMCARHSAAARSTPSYFCPLW
jgi:hypothetical protein